MSGMLYPLGLSAPFMSASSGEKVRLTTPAVIPNGKTHLHFRSLLTIPSEAQHIPETTAGRSAAGAGAGRAPTHLNALLSSSSRVVLLQTSLDPVARSIKHSFEDPRYHMGGLATGKRCRVMERYVACKIQDYTDDFLIRRVSHVLKEETEDKFVRILGSRSEHSDREQYYQMALNDRDKQQLIFGKKMTVFQRDGHMVNTSNPANQAKKTYVIMDDEGLEYVEFFNTKYATCPHSDAICTELLVHFIQMATLVLAATSHKVVHGDIKADNFMIKENKLSLLDFEFAVHDGERMTELPSTHAPETTIDEPTLVSADIYQLGKTYEHHLNLLKPTEESGMSVFGEGGNFQQLIIDMIKDPKDRPRILDVIERLVKCYQELTGHNGLDDLPHLCRDYVKLVQGKMDLIEVLPANHKDVLNIQQRSVNYFNALQKMLATSRNCDDIILEDSSTVERTPSTTFRTTLEDMGAEHAIARQESEAEAKLD